jgi:hypothetical protein
MTRWERWSPLAGVLAVAGMVVAFAIAGNSPGSNDSDAKITSYYASHSHQVRQLVALFVFLAGILFLLAFFATLRARLVAAESGHGRLGALAFGAGVASAVLWFSSVCFFVAPAITVNDTKKFSLDPNTFRILNDLGYELWVGAVVVGAIVVWATSAVALRTALLPRWFAWLGILVGVILLFAIFFVPAFVYWGWILIAAGLLAWRPPVAPVPAPTVSPTP